MLVAFDRAFGFARTGAGANDAQRLGQDRVSDSHHGAWVVRSVAFEPRVDALVDPNVEQGSELRELIAVEAFAESLADLTVDLSDYVLGK